MLSPVKLEYPETIWDELERDLPATTFHTPSEWYDMADGRVLPLYKSISTSVHCYCCIEEAATFGLGTRGGGIGRIDFFKSKIPLRVFRHLFHGKAMHGSTIHSRGVYKFWYYTMTNKDIKPKRITRRRKRLTYQKSHQHLRVLKQWPV